MKKRSNRFNTFITHSDNLIQQFDEAALYGETLNNTKQPIIINGITFPANHLAEEFDAAMWHGSQPPVDSVNKKRKIVKTEDDKSKAVTPIQASPLAAMQDSNQTSASPSLDSSSEALCSTSLSTSTNKEGSIVVFRTPITEPKIKFEKVINTSQTTTYTHL